MQHKNNPIAGISWFILHCLIFAFISLITKILMKQGLHVFEIVYFQTAIGALILLPQILFLHRKNLKNIAVKIQVARAILWISATIAFFYATQVLPMGRAIAISFTVPLFTSIFAVIFLKEKLNSVRVIGLIVGFIGMLFIIRPGFDSFEPISLLVVAASFMWSMTDIMIKMVGKTHNAYVNTFYFTIFGAICTLPLAIFVWNTPNTTQMLWLILLAALFIGNMVSITKAYECCDLTIVMPFVFTELIFVAVLAYFTFGEVISLWTAIGSVVIVASSSYIALYERKTRGHFVDEDLVEELVGEIGVHKLSSQKLE